MFNRYFDDERGEIYIATVKLFDEIKKGKFDAYTSPYAVDELKNAPEPKRSQMLGLIDEYKINMLKASIEAEKLADAYIKNGIIPKGSDYDAKHIAVASINKVDYILSLNFRHINRVLTKTLFLAINKINGYNNDITIYSPMEVIENG